MSASVESGTERVAARSVPDLAVLEEHALPSGAPGAWIRDAIAALRDES